MIGPHSRSIPPAITDRSGRMSETLGADPHWGAVRVFRLSRGGRIKVVWFDGTGPRPPSSITGGVGVSIGSREGLAVLARDAVRRRIISGAWRASLRDAEVKGAAAGAVTGLKRFRGTLPKPGYLKGVRSTATRNFSSKTARNIIIPKLMNLKS